jgi:polar amino acid transport system substrate-binding protein
MKKTIIIVNLMAVTTLVLSACGGSATTDNLLNDIKNRGYILVSTDPNYEPQSFLNIEGKRPADTACPSDALTTAEIQGFDVDVAIAVGEALGVESCFVTPDWNVITAGNWDDAWDVSIGSMTITTARQEVLDFSVPYYYTPAVIAVSADSDFASLDDLAGEALCVASATTYEIWLNQEDIGLPASSIYAQPPDGINIVPLDTDQECALALAAGREDFAGYVTSQTVVNANIAAGQPVKQVGSAVFSEDLAPSYDKASTLPTDSLRAAIDEIITGMHNDGTLTALSMKWFIEDITMDPTQ